MIADLDRRKIRDAAQEMQNQFQRTGDLSGRALEQGITAKMPAVEKALDKATAASGRFLVEQQKLDTLMKKSGDNRDKIISQSERVSVAYQRESSALREVQAALSTVTPAAGGATDSLAEMGSTLGKLGKLATPAAIAAIGAGLFELTGIASAASGAIGLLPGAIGGAVSAFGTLKLATLGFGDAMKDMGDPEKFAEDLQKLAPNAQQAALALQQLMPAFTQLKNATQDALFAGVGPQLTQVVNQLLPTVQQATTSIASSMNQAFMGATNQLMTPQTQANLKAFTDNIGAAFQALAPAAAPLTQAFTQLAAVSSSFMPQLAQAASQAATSFANFISEASKSGQLQQWIQTGITVMRQMMSIVGELTQGFFALGPEGVRAMNEIKTAVVFTADAVRALNGDVGGLKDLFPTVGDIAVNVFNRIGSAIDTFILGPLRLLGNLPGFGALKDAHIGQFTTDHLGGGPLGGGPGLGVSPGTTGYPSGDPNKPMQWVPGQGWVPAATGGLPVPMGAPGLGSGTLAGSASGRGGTGAYTWGNPPPKDAAGPGGRLGQAPAVPYDQTLPPEFAQLPQTAEILSAENNWLGARHQLAEKRARVTQLEQTVTATESDRIGAANDVIEAQQAQNEALLRVNNAAQNLYEKNNKQLSGYADQMGEIGAKLDQDLGISKGLPGIAENLFKFVANLAAAPMLGQLNAIANAPGQAQGGYGLMGILGAQGAFGPQYTAAGQAAAAAATSSGTSPSAMGPAGLQPGGAYPGDAALLANVPAGRYTQTDGADLTQGLADCSSAVEDLVNLMDGRPTGGRSMATGNADQWLTAHGFQQGSMPGAFNVGFNSGHMQATLPGGTPFNWGSDAAAARGGVGGTGAFDPAFTSHYYRPVGGGGGGGGAMPGADWNAIAQGESGGNWQTNTGNGYSGGLQFLPSTWAANGGLQFAPEAWQASPQQQIAVGENTLASQGPGAWPNTFAPATTGTTSAATAQQGFGGIPIPLPVTIVGGGGISGGAFGAPSAPGAAPGTPASGQGTGPAPGPGGGGWGLPGGPLPQGGQGFPLPATPFNPFGPPPGPPGAPNIGPGPIQPGGGVPFDPNLVVGGTAPGQAVGTPLWNFGRGADAATQGGVGASAVTPLTPGGGTAGWGTPGGAPGAAPGGPPAAGPTQIGGVDPLQGSGKGGVGMSEGGSLDTAMGLAASAVPGLGQAAQTGMKLANRAIQYGGQVAGIMTQGALDTWLPMGGSKLAQGSWLTKIVGGLAGAAPALPNMAGKGSQQQQQVDPNTTEHGTGEGKPPGPTNGVYIDKYQVSQSEDRAGADLARHQMAQYGG